MRKTKSLPPPEFVEHLTLNDIALAFAGVMHAQSWWQAQRHSAYAARELAQYVALNKKLSAILDKFSFHRNEEGEIHDNGDDSVTLIWEPYAS